MMRILTFIGCIFFVQVAFSQVYINEMCASNATVLENTAYSDFNDWIELYNSGASAVDLSGYFLTDNASDTTKWALPAGTIIAPNGFLLVWADGNNSGLHTSYSLTRIGEEVALYGPNLALVDYFAYGEQLTDVSFGRQTNGSAILSYFTEPTPGASNNTATAYEHITRYEPIVRPKGGFYSHPVKVSFENVSTYGVVRYTLDGSIPTVSSPFYIDTLNITQTTVVKARVFLPNEIPGPITTNTYFINEHFEDRNLPVVSLSTNPAYFWDNDIGLYVQDFKPDWEYPIHVEFYEADGLLGFHHDMGVRLDGENAWALPQKLLLLSSRKQYSPVSKIAYQIFPESQRTTYENILLRCSGNDWSNTLFRDGMQQKLTQTDMDLDCQFFRPCIVYINGQYLGIHNLRNKVDEEYLENKFGTDPDSVDMIANEGVVKAGNLVAYTALQDFLTAGVASNTSFAALEQKMDVANYTDYIISEMFGGNTSWGHNIMSWKAQNDTSIFRWLLFDYDRGFNLSNLNGVDMSFFTATNGPDWSNPPSATLPFRKMLENSDYELRFIGRFADCLYTTYHPNTINRTIDHFAANIRNEMPYHADRWAGTTSSYGDGIVSPEFWENEVLLLHSFANGRNAYLYTNIDDFFGLDGTVNLQLATTGTTHGFVRFNHQNAMRDEYRLGKYFRNFPFELTAEPKTGYSFVRWDTITQSVASLFSNASWKYRDAATAPPTNWMQPTFDDATWPTGDAQLGYGDGDEATILNYGSDPTNKTIAYYFRKTFNVTNTGFSGDLTLNLVADDGAVVYINGNEVTRYNMPLGAVNSDTWAINAVSSPSENAVQVFSVPASLLNNGTNTIAVEIHQADPGSSDVSFEADLIAVTNGGGSAYSTASTIALNLSTDIYLKAIFVASPNVCLLPDTVSSNTTLYASCSPYYAQGNVTVKPNASLVVEPGVKIIMPQSASIYIFGDLQINGTADSGVVISPNTALGATNWGGLLFRNTTSLSHINYFTLDKASRGPDLAYNKAAISAYKSNINIDHLTATNVIDNPIFARYSNILMTNSEIHSLITGDCINVKQGFATVENCTFVGSFAVDMDAIDYDGVTGGIVRNCTIHDFRGDNNDGLDIGEECHDLLIKNNFIYRCFDKGISCGQESSVTLEDNTIADCNIGVALKDLSPVNINHCTFYGNGIAISAYEKNAGYKGGIGTVTNCILSNSTNKAWSADTFSVVNITNSLSDTEVLTGEGNLSTNPLFVDAPHYQFQVHPNSPIINAGNDNDDMGSPYFDYIVPNSNIMLSEILYNDNVNSENEFIELYNASDETVDLSGYTLSEAIDFTFPEGASIAPTGYVVVARNAANYPNVACPIYTWTNGKLANEGERIVLTDTATMVADFVRYGSSAPWIDSTQTVNHSLELIQDTLDNHFYTSWQISMQAGGSPGTNLQVSVSDHLSSPNTLSVYPNPANHDLFISSNQLFEQQQVIIEDMIGHIVLSQPLPDGQNKYHLAIAHLPTGVYVVHVGSASQKLLITGS